MLLIDQSTSLDIPGVELPQDLYWVLTEPAPLGGMRRPWPGVPWDSISDAGFSSIVCLDESSPYYDPTPLIKLVSTNMEDLIHGGPPRNPESEQQLVNQVVGSIVKEICSGKGVLVHCYGGRGRTGTVLGCVLRRLGYPSEEIIIFLDTIHKKRGKSGWPESIWQMDLVREFE